MDLNYEIIGKKIKEIRQQKHLTQEKLAEMCNLSASYISYIESAKKKKASLESLVKLANNLGVTVDTFLNEYQKNDTNEYESALMRLFENCNSNEKRMIFKIAVSIKEILLDNN
ncbi:MAG: helix-turn-helix transcriptional regulator [Candidatus Gastranaerophilales bacterium]|nr:helix-turn-helix transcriptional regulator [Candidatus Gastranaerophilales bacterium]